MLVQVVLVLMAMIVRVLQGQMNVVVGVIFAHQQYCPHNHERE